MKEVLLEAQVALPELVEDVAGWQGLRINDEQPVIHRLWRPFGEGRLCLHEIYPCEREEALYHPHPWPSAMLVLEGEYFMDIGTEGCNERPPVLATVRLGRGDFYEMVNADAYHRIWTAKPAYTLFVTGKPWGRGVRKSTRPLPALSAEEVCEQLAYIKNIRL